MLEATPIGSIILSEHPVFKAYSISIFNTKTNKHDINYVMDNIEADKYLDKKYLRRKYDSFKLIYEDLVT